MGEILNGEIDEEATAAGMGLHSPTFAAHISTLET